jgi:hypothetical protein
VKNHDFTPKNHIFPILGGGAPGAPSWIRPCCIVCALVVRSVSTLNTTLFICDVKKNQMDGLWLWCLTPLSTIFQLYGGLKQQQQ